MLDTKKLVIEALAKALHIDNLSAIDMNSNLKEDLGLDSMSSLTFLMLLEESVSDFYVDPDTLDSDDLLTVETITAYVDKQLSLNRNVA